MPILRADGDWSSLLPDREWQRRNGYESMNCVRFSFLSCIESIGLHFGVKLNLSDRWLAFNAGECGEGTWLWLVANAFGKVGCVAESLWPWTTEATKADYCSIPPKELYPKALELFDTWQYGGVADLGKVTVDILKEALKRGPVWFCNSNHAMMIYKVDDRIRIFDTYGAECKGSYPLEYVSDIEAAYLIDFTPKLAKPMQFPNNSLVVVVQQPDTEASDPINKTCGRYMNIDNTCLFKDDAAKLLTELIARNADDGKFTEMPVVHCHPRDIVGVQFLNLKREIVQ